METIISHIAAELNMDPMDVQQQNLAATGLPFGPTNVYADTILPLLKAKSMLDQRKLEVAQFNKVRIQMNSE